MLLKSMLYAVTWKWIMNLLLEIISHQRYMMTDVQSQFIFKASGGTIGRNQNNDWLIDDPERLISGQHASIYFENDQFVILDTSTNGLFVNKNQQALSDQSHIIINGDIFLLGQFSIQATLIATQSKAVFSTSNSHSFLDKNEQELQVLSGHTAAIANNSSVSNDSAVSLVSHELPQNINQSVDPLSHFNNTSIPGHFAGHDILSEFAAVDSVLDPIPSTQSYFDLPNAIPENWLHNQSEQQEIQTDIIGPNNQKNHENIVGSFEDFKKDFNVDSLNQEIIDNKEAISDSAIESGDLISIDEKPENFHINGTKQTFNSTKSDSYITPESASLNKTQMDAINVLFETLGINPADIPPEQIPELLKNIALIAKNSMSGIMKSMISRAHLKNEFRLSMTTIKTQENNPLKFCINYEQLVHYMLLNPISGYLDAEQAVKESFEELQEHQLGVVAGMKSAFKTMLDKLSPEKIVHKVNQSKLISLPLSSKKSRYWDTFNDLYNDIEEEDDVFDTLFGNEFCKAYERQVENIRQAKK